MIKNPLLLNDPAVKDKTADPHVLYHEGKYYHTYTANDALYVAEFSSLAQFSGEGREDHLVFESEALEQCFAPELHLIDGDFYIYAAPAHRGDTNHFVCVFKSVDKTPTGRFEALGTVDGIGERWAIDATTFVYRGVRYMVYTTCKEIYIAKMKSPTALDGASVCLKTPEYAWETVMSGVVEGPAVIFDGDVPVLVYSASDSKCDDYCLGMMRMEGDDPLDASAWKKHGAPILTKAPEMFGPGHCSFTEEGGALVCVYHANLVSGSGWYGRSIFAKECFFENGILKFKD